MLVRILCTIFLGTFSLTQVFSQANYKSGYLVTAQGDSLRGELNDQEWERTPRKINFRQAGVVKTYEVGEISRFGVDGGDHYVKMTVSRSTRPVEMNRLLDDFQDTTITEPVLLRVVADGAWKLYALYMEKPIFYVQAGEAAPEELVYILRQQPNSLNFTTFNTFRDQLKALQLREGGTADVSKTLERLRYREPDLALYFRSHNGQTSDKSTSTRWKINSKFYVGTGVNFNRFKMEGVFFGRNGMDLKGSVSPTFQAGVDLSAGRNRQRLVLRLEVGASQSRATHHSEIPKSLTNTAKRIDYDLRYFSIEPGIQILYNFLVYERQKYYLGVSTTYNVSQYKTNRMTVEEPDWDRTTVTDPYLDMEKSWGGFSFRGGAILTDRFDVGARIAFRGNLVRMNQVNFKPRPVALLVNYRF